MPVMSSVGMRGAVVVALLISATAAAGQEGPARHYDFEHDRPGQMPAQWYLGCTVESRTTAEVSRSLPASGSQCVRLTKRGDADFGNLMQSFDARLYRGKRVRFRAAVRVQPAAPDSRARLWMRITRPDNTPGFFDNMRDRPIRTTNWTSHMIDGNVPQDAERVFIGVLVNGRGQVWVDDVVFEVIGDAVRDEDVDEARAAPIEGVAVVAVKDFMRLENRGKAVADLEFPRYFPAIDDEQFVLGRWVAAATDKGRRIRITIAEVSPDPQGNLVHTYRIPRFPENEGVVVTVTSLVLRRERAAPEGAFPIPSPDEYPEHVRPFLQSTATVVVDQPDIRAAARTIRQTTSDAYAVANEIAALMKANTYTQRGRPDYSLPTSARVLRHGGSCCGSAVCAAALFRACGIPAQITYCPAGYVHGVIRFYLQGYGWCRMDSTSGTGRLPFVRRAAHRGFVRLYDMPLEMETIEYAYAWPFQHNTITDEYKFHSGGEVIPTVRFAARDEAEARRNGRPSGHVLEPFPHLEPGSWNTVFAIEQWEIEEGLWGKLKAESHAATCTDHIALYPKVRQLLGDRADRAWCAKQVRRLKEYGELPRGR